MCEAVHSGTGFSRGFLLTLRRGIPYDTHKARFFMKIFEKSGFSLVELMIVVAIIAIASAIAAPYYVDYMADQRLKGAARMVMSDLMAARQKAVSMNHEFKIFFNGDHITYTILADADNDGTADTGETTEVRNIQNNYYDVTFSASANPVFQSRGTSSAATVTLTSSRTGGSKYVKVAITGRVKAVDNPLE
jgi:type II secretion system protein H